MKLNWNRFNMGVVTAGLIFLYLPLLFLVMGSFGRIATKDSQERLTTNPYYWIFGDPGFIDAAGRSLRIALISASIAMALGTIGAIILSARSRSPGQLIHFAAFGLPLVLPPVIGGLSLLMAYIAVGLKTGTPATIVAHATVGICLVAVVVRYRLNEVNDALLEVAMDLGAGPGRTLLSVVLPLVLPAVLAGWILAFLLSLGDFILARFTAIPETPTLPLMLYELYRDDRIPQANALGVLLVLPSLLGVLIVILLNRKAQTSQ